MKRLLGKFYFYQEFLPRILEKINQTTYQTVYLYRPIIIKTLKFSVFHLDNNIKIFFNILQNYYLKFSMKQFLSLLILKIIFLKVLNYYI